MLNAFRPSDCDRARAAASAQLDGELPELETVFLDAHTRSCESCSRFAAEIAAVTGLVRWAELERPAGFAVPLRSGRRRVAPLRALAAVSAAAAVSIAVLSNLERVQSVSRGEAVPVFTAVRPAVADPPASRQPLSSVVPFLSTSMTAPHGPAPSVEL